MLRLYHPKPWYVPVELKDVLMEVPSSPNLQGWVLVHYEEYAPNEARLTFRQLRTRRSLVYYCSFKDLKTNFPTHNIKFPQNKELSREYQH